MHENGIRVNYSEKVQQATTWQTKNTVQVSCRRKHYFL